MSANAFVILTESKGRVERMGETADYFKRERYITRRLSLLVLGGTLVLVPITLAVVRGRIAPIALTGALVAVVLGVVVSVVLILRAANAKFPKSATPDNLPLDAKTCRKLRRRILFLEAFVAVYAFILVSTIWHAQRGQWPGVLCGSAFVLLMEFALIKAIRRLKLKLKEGAVVSARQLTNQPISSLD